MKVQADNVNGVYEVEEFEEIAGIPMSEDVFYSCLKDNDDDSIICADISEEMANKIRAEYGIN